MKPFENDSEAVSLGEMNIENGTRAVALHGSLDITRDKAGLDKARALQDRLAEIVSALEADPDLPDTIAPGAPSGITRVRNPLAPGDGG